MTKHSATRFGLICGFASLTAVAGAQAQEGVAVKNLLGSMGIISPEKDPIRYRERAPLVLPPKMELRTPAGAETYASNNPQWPQDPDVVERKRRSAQERLPAMETETRRMSDNNPRLSVDELRAGRNPNGPGPGRHKGDRDGVWLSPTELAAGRSNPDEDKAENETPARRTLTDPPSTLRKTARNGPVETQFQGKVDQQELDANPINWLTRKFRSSDDD